MRSFAPAWWSALPRITKVCGVIGVPVLCWIVWIDVALAHQPVRHVDEGVGQGLITLFLGPAAFLLVVAAAVGVRREGAARVIAYCGVLWPVVMEVACFAAFTFY